MVTAPFTWLLWIRQVVILWRLDEGFDPNGGGDDDDENDSDIDDNGNFGGDDDNDEVIFLRR